MTTATTRRRSHDLFRLLLLFLPLLILARRTSAATQAEKDALLLFKSSITSDPRGALASWTPIGDPCRDFFGVTCAVPSGSVERLRLHSAGLAGPLSPALASLPGIQSISLFDNLLSGTIPREVAAIATLHKLNLSRNALQGPVPPELGAVQGLRLLDLSWNNLSGGIPPQLFSRSCFRLRYVSLAHNALIGPVPGTVTGCAPLEGLDFSFNALSGQIPPGICAPPGMSYLSFRSNTMSGTAADKLAGCRALRLLDLGSNGFTGPPPLEPLRLPTLTYFNVSFNGFAGNVARGLACGARIEYLDVSSNQITGGIEPFVVGCAGVKWLSLGFNRFTGGIPPEIGGMKSLSVLSLGGNPLLGGVIPTQIADADLLVLLDLHDLNLTGRIPDTVSNLRFLLQLDASGNQLEGPIPVTLYNLTWINLLDLHSNRLDGVIPAELGELSRLETLDLSQNSLDGPIPASLTNLTQLSRFNLSYNNLTGQIPQDPALLKFGPEAFSHNPGLCGAPLNAVCGPGQGGEAGTRQPSRRLLSTSAIVAIVAAAVILVGVCVITVVNLRARGRRGPPAAVAAAGALPSYSTKSPSLSRERAEEEEVLVSESLTAESTAGSSIIIGKLVLFGNGLPSRHEDWEAGTKALLDKNCIIGRGVLGTVYRATLDGGAVTIAVKKLDGLGSIRDQDEFEQEIGRLGGVRHPNLVAFHGYYWSPTAQLLLTEFVSNGDLHRHLHGGGAGGGWGRGSGSQFPWPRRFGVAIGIARTLAYLHHDCKPQVLHLNLKSTNILLDDDFRPKLSDYGLARLMLPHQRPRGYAAPELAAAAAAQGVASDKCDVYSFGVVLLELVTGRQPAEASPSLDGLTVALPDYVRGLLERGAGASCFDRRLRGVAENELVQVLKFGLICTAEPPSRRPSMAEVVQYLESIRPASGAIS